MINKLYGYNFAYTINSRPVFGLNCPELAECVYTQSILEDICSSGECNEANG
jgi:hypothetical protein